MDKIVTLKTIVTNERDTLKTKFSLANSEAVGALEWVFKVIDRLERESIDSSRNVHNHGITRIDR